MPGYVHAQRAPARHESTDHGATEHRPGVQVAVRDGVTAGHGVLADALNESPQAQSLLQMRRTLDQGPRVQSQLALQRALNRRGAGPAQAEVAEASPQSASALVQRKPNVTGLPDRLKAGVESLSGLALDDVRVHYNSSKPAAVQAHAYAQGTDIHVAPGQEQHLPHEAWHVVQQKQGRVKPTLQLKGVAINDDTGLEREADAMGGRAANPRPLSSTGLRPEMVSSEDHKSPIQAKLFIKHGDQSETQTDWQERVRDTGEKDPFPPSAAQGSASNKKKRAGERIDDSYFWIVRHVLSDLVAPYQDKIFNGQTTGNPAQTEIKAANVTAEIAQNKKSAGFRLVHRVIVNAHAVVIDPWIALPGRKAFFADPKKPEDAETKGVGSAVNVAFGLYEPRETAVEGQLIGKKPQMEKSSPKIVLGHELIHADHAQRGTFKRDKTQKEYRVHGQPTTFSSADEEEQQTVGLGSNKDADNITENDLRKQHGIPLRISYDAEDYKTTQDKRDAARMLLKNAKKQQKKERERQALADEKKKEDDEAGAAEQMKVMIAQANAEHKNIVERAKIHQANKAAAPKVMLEAAGGEAGKGKGGNAGGNDTKEAYIPKQIDPRKK